MYARNAQGCPNLGKFEYPRFEVSYHIRIVALQPGSAIQPIHCRLFNVDFTRNPVYDALSYEWGPSSKDNQTIWVNNSAHVVRKNLYNALLCLRRPDTERFLWIDALCINQDDVSERNHQVELMSRIFGRADEVIVWLGAAHDDSETAITHMERIHQAAYPFVSLALVNDACYDAESKAIAALCNRTYWQRLWIVQEVYLARRLIICCGQKCLSWESFNSALRYTGSEINPANTAILQQIRTSLAVQLVQYKKFEGLSLCDWIRLTQKFLCTDPRDKVFALLGIAIDCVDNFRADYSKELPQIYEDVLQLYASIGANPECEFDIFAFSRALQDCFGQHLPYTVPESWKTQCVTACAVICGPITSLSGETLFPPDVTKLPPKNVLSRLSDIETRQDFDNTIFIENTPILHLIRRSSNTTTIDKIMIPSKDGRAKAQGSILNLYGDIIGNRTFDQSGNTARYMFMGTHRGFVPSNTKEGDHLCLFKQTDIALILRKELNFWILVGRGSMLDPIDADISQLSLSVESKIPRASGPQEISETVSLQLNIETLQKLTKT